MKFVNFDGNESSVAGIPMSHLRALSEVASEENTIVGIRPVSQFATHFIESGCPTKPFAVKNKSANSGIVAGLIPIDPQFGRVKTLEDQAKYTAMLEKAYKSDPDLKPIALTLTQERFNELTVLFGSDNITFKEVQNPDGYKIQWVNNNKTVTAYAFPSLDGPGFEIYNERYEPLTVLGKAATVPANNPEGTMIKIDKPITADYDLLMIGPAYNKLDPGGADKTPFRTQGLLRNSFNKNQKQVIQSDKTPTGPKEHEKGGNWSPRIEAISSQINNKISEYDELRRGPGLELVHHNAEFNNPFADSLENHLPAVIILPKPIGELYSESNLAGVKGSEKATVVVVESVQELNDLRQLLQEQGYYWPNQAKYSKQMPPFKLESTEAAFLAVASMKDRMQSMRDLEPEQAVEKIEEKEIVDTDESNRPVSP